MTATPDGLTARRLASLPWIDPRISRARIEVWLRTGETGVDRKRRQRPLRQPTSSLAPYVVITREDLESDLNYGRDE